jgi:hypothetical protein
MSHINAGHMDWLATTQGNDEMIMCLENWGDWVSNKIHPHITWSSHYDDDRTFWGAFDVMQYMLACLYGRELGLTIRYKSDESY